MRRWGPYDPWNYPYLGGPPPGRFRRGLHHIAAALVMIAWVLFAIALVAVAVGTFVGLWFR